MNDGLLRGDGDTSSTQGGGGEGLEGDTLKGVAGGKCSTHTSCWKCTIDPECGWCDGMSLCMGGDEKGPNLLTSCSYSWYKVIKCI